MNCNKNDLAYIKKAIRPENVGRVVICKEMLGHFKVGEKILWNGEHTFSPDTDNIWVVTAQSGIETMYGPSKEGLIADTWLRPIKADPLEDDDLVHELNENLETV